jgi:hypothetical protein
VVDPLRRARAALDAALGVGGNGAGDAHEPEADRAAAKKAADEEAERLLRSPRREEIATVADLKAAGARERWLCPGWLPTGVLTAIASEPGLGKTRFCLDVVRRIRRGLPWIDGSPMTAPPDAVAMWVVGDNHHDQMVTHSEEFGVADGIYLNALRTDPFGGVSLDSLEDLAAFEARLKAVRPALAVIDTVGNTTELNLSRSEDARLYYAPLQVIARKYECAIFCLTHLNAGGKILGRRVLEKVRVAIQMSQPDPGDQRRRLWVSKSFSRRPAPLGMTMADGGCEYDDSPPADPEEAGQAPSAPAPGEPTERVQEVMRWLRAQLADGSRRVSVIRGMAEKHGIATKTLYAAKRLVQVEEFESEGRKWWRLTAEGA